MATDDERIAAAIASGQWKEKTDTKSGRKYYVNTKTRKSVWNIIEALNAQEAAGAPAAAQSPVKNVREERQEKLKRKAEQIADLKASIAALEQRKVETEAEVARLRPPVEMESKQIEELRAEVNDMKFSLKVVENENSEKRRSREAELKSALGKLEILKSQVDAEKQHRGNIESRRRQLNAEALDLKTDLHKEQVNTEALKASLRAAERKHEESRAELRRLEDEISMEEDSVRRAEEDLQVLAKRKIDVQKKMERAVRQRTELTERLSVSRQGEQKKKDTDLLQQLAIRYETKKRTLKTLAERDEQTSDAKMYEHGNQKLRQLLESAERDQHNLMQLSDCIDAETKRVQGLTEAYLNQLQVVRAATSSEMMGGNQSSFGGASAAPMHVDVTLF